MAIPAKAAFDVFMDVRGTVVFYLFILEESIQTAMMGCYLASKAGETSRSQILAIELKQGLIADAKAFNQSVGIVAYPMNEAFGAFYTQAENMCNFYANPPIPEE